MRYLFSVSHPVTTARGGEEKEHRLKTQNKTQNTDLALCEYGIRSSCTRKERLHCSCQQQHCLIPAGVQL